MPTKESYNSCLKTLYSLRRYGIILGLDIIGNILKGVGNPQNNFNTIHVAGTNGKGSIASALSTILHKAGYKVGLYTSPHLVRFNERICINTHPVSDENVVDAYKAVKSVTTALENPLFLSLQLQWRFMNSADTMLTGLSLKPAWGGGSTQPTL